MSRIGWVVTILFVTIASGCRADSEDEGTAVEAAAVGDRTLTLHSQGDRCVVRLDDGDEIALGLPGPCAYLRRNRAKRTTVQHYAGIGHVVIVAGAPAPRESYREDDWAKPEDRCSSHAQGLVVDKGTVRLGKVQNSRVSFCPGIGLDEKSYYGVAHSGD